MNERSRPELEGQLEFGDVVDMDPVFGDLSYTEWVRAGRPRLDRQQHERCETCQARDWKGWCPDCRPHAPGPRPRPIKNLPPL